MTTGILGAVGAGTPPTGTPNVTVVWAAGDLDVAAGAYVWQLVASAGGLDRKYTGQFTVTPAIS